MSPSAVCAADFSPSWFAIRSADLNPVTSRAAEREACCAACGLPLSVGDACNDFKPNKSSFLDYAALADSASPYLCGACVVIWQKLFMRKLANVVITKDAFYKFASNEDRSYWLLNPPEPPFIMQSSDAQMQHLIWRDRIALSRDVFPIRFGNTLGYLRHSRLLKVWRATGPVMKFIDAMLDKLPRGQRRKPLQVLCPLGYLDRDRDSTNYGRPIPAVQKLLRILPAARKAELRARLLPFQALNTTELWALGILLRTKDPSNLQRPVQLKVELSRA